MTRRLFYDDSYQSRFRARIVDRGCDPSEVYLDHTAFYPTSGGQPYDTGTIAGVTVIDVCEVGDRILHRIAQPVNQDDAECEIDWPRRFDHMQQHSGQHLLSAVFTELFEATTVSFHLGRQASTIDLEVSSLSADQLKAAEQRANELVFENHSVSVSYENAAEAEDLRGEIKRPGELRIITIEGCDRTACGGTHVRSTAEIGPIQLRKLDKVRTTFRVEFLCGNRAVRRARSDFDALSECARVFSATLDETPALVAAQQRKLADADRARKRLARELATFRGQELYRETAADESGYRRVVRSLSEGPATDDLRGEAQSFTEGSRAVFLVFTEKPPSVLLAVSADAGLHAGNLLKEALANVGGRGGGNARLAQGSLPSEKALVSFWEELASRFPGAA